MTAPSSAVGRLFMNRPMDRQVLGCGSPLPLSVKAGAIHRLDARFGLADSSWQTGKPPAPVAFQ